MPEFAKGLRLDVPDRDVLQDMFSEHGHDPAIHFEIWGANAPPERMYIVSYEFDEEYYHILNKHVNGETTTAYLDSEILEKLINTGAINVTDEYNTKYVEHNT